jgi:hypothetical protein
MKTWIIILIIVFLFLIPLSSVYCAEELTSKDLIKNAEQYDGQRVIYKGEVIGDIMQRGKFVWLNVRDDYAAVGVWSPKELTEDIIFTGSYKFRGDYIKIAGVLNRACSQHGGELDIHADSIIKLKEGVRLKEELSPQKRKTTLLLLGVAICLGILQILRRKQ